MTGPVGEPASQFQLIRFGGQVYLAERSPQRLTLYQNHGGNFVSIGSGRAATPEDAGQARQEIARLLSGRRALRLLYGGSVNPGNAADLLRRSGMEGFLIGGASLSSDDFAAIAGLP